MEYSDFEKFMDFCYWDTHFNKGPSQLYDNISKQFMEKFKGIRHVDSKVVELEKCTEKEICYFFYIKWRTVRQENYDRLKEMYGDDLETKFPNVYRIYNIVQKYYDRGNTCKK